MPCQSTSLTKGHGLFIRPPDIYDLYGRYSPFLNASGMALVFCPRDERTENTSIVTKGITAQLLSPKTLLQTDSANDARCSATHSTVLQQEVFISAPVPQPCCPSSIGATSFRQQDRRDKHTTTLSLWSLCNQ